MEEIFSISREASYQDRCIMLKDQRVALWDTLKTCTRTSSLDSDIADSSIVPNDISSFLRKHPQIELICFNGAKSEKVFSKNVAPTLAASALRVELVRLPSTSPANASIPIDVKLDQWQVIAR
jgi:TDG/mug DNA glycosylase family protein